MYGLLPGAARPSSFTTSARTRSPVIALPMNGGGTNRSPWATRVSGIRKPKPLGCRRSTPSTSAPGGGRAIAPPSSRATFSAPRSSVIAVSKAERSLASTPSDSAMASSSMGWYRLSATRVRMRERKREGMGWRGSGVASSFTREDGLDCRSTGTGRSFVEGPAGVVPGLLSPFTRGAVRVSPGEDPGDACLGSGEVRSKQGVACAGGRLRGPTASGLPTLRPVAQRGCAGS